MGRSMPSVEDYCSLTKPSSWLRIVTIDILFLGTLFKQLLITGINTSDLLMGILSKYLLHLSTSDLAFISEFTGSVIIGSEGAGGPLMG